MKEIDEVSLLGVGPCEGLGLGSVSWNDVHWLCDSLICSVLPGDDEVSGLLCLATHTAVQTANHEIMKLLKDLTQ